MAGNIKGITIEFDGNTTKLDKAIKDIDKSTRSLDKELRNINSALKFNPTSVELWRQKQQVLTQKIADTKKKLDVLKQAQAKMDAEGVDKNSQEYRELQREIIETESKLKNFEGQLKKIGNNVNLRAASEQFKQYGETLTAAGQALMPLSKAGAAVTAGLGAMAYKAGTAADDLNTMAKVTGVGTEALQKYGLAADLVDVSVEDIAKSNKRLVKSAYSAQRGSKAQTEAFEKLGVSVTDSNGNLRDSEAIFQDTITALGKMTNETERDALAQQLMGKSAANLNPLIEDGGETYKKVAETMSKYGLDYVDQETLDKANEFNDSLDTMKLMGKAALGQVSSQLAGYLAPALAKVTDLFGKFAGWISKLDPKILSIVGVIGSVLAVLGPLLIGMGKVAFAISSIMGVAAKIGPIIKGLSIGFNPWVLAIAAAVAAGILLYKNWDKIKAYAKKLWATIKPVFQKIGNFMKKVWDGAVKVVTTVWKGIVTVVRTYIKIVRTVITTVFNFIKAYFKTVFNIYKTIIVTAWKVISTAIKIAVNLIKKIVTAVFNGLKTYFTTVFNFYKTIIVTAWNVIKTAVTTAVNAIKNTITTVFNAVKGTVSKVWNAIKTAITTPINAAKNAVNTAVNNIKAKVTGGFNGISGKVKSAFSKVKDAITSPFQKAWELVKSAVDKIKSIFPIKLGKIFSGVKLPHFKISGGTPPWGIGGKGTRPSVDIEWYAKGGIFKRPTVFATPNGLKGVGEAGAEAVVPLSELWSQMANMGNSIAEGVSRAGGDEITINVYAQPGMDIKALAEEIERRMVESQKRRKVAWQ